MHQPHSRHRLFLRLNVSAMPLIKESIEFEEKESSGSKQMGSPRQGALKVNVPNMSKASSQITCSYLPTRTKQLPCVVCMFYEGASSLLQDKDLVA